MDFSPLFVDALVALLILGNYCFGFLLAPRFGRLLLASCALLHICEMSVLAVTHWPSRIRATHRNVPPENNNRIPVHHFISAGSVCPPPPSALTTTHVPTAPIGAARLKTTRCALAALFPSPCLSRTEVSPNAAGALWTMMATKMMSDKEVVEVDEDDAPSAMPSAAAWIHRPSVVEIDRCGVASAGGGDVESSERE